MKRSVKLYNVLLPIWILYFFPQVWLITLPGNLLIDCLVLLLTLAALKHTGKRAVLKKLWWKFWLLGFLADFIGAALLFGVWYLSLLPEPVGPWVEGIIYDAFVNPFRSLPALLYTLAGVALAGVCIYFFDKRAMRSCPQLDGRQRHIIALAMAVAGGRPLWPPVHPPAGQGLRLCPTGIIIGTDHFTQNGGWTWARASAISAWWPWESGACWARAGCC